ncbi:hypothetical protein F4824DRAFT_185952 [Ustulina deusta]|nr:hypothetical protein F4824DRAFT_185952 [Ustulina deusta]
MTRFTDDDEYKGAKASWEFLTPCSVRQVILGCNPHPDISTTCFERQPYVIRQIAYGDATNTATLYGPAKDWQVAFNGTRQNVLVNTRGILNNTASASSSAQRRQNADIFSLLSINRRFSENIFTVTNDAGVSAIDRTNCGPSGFLGYRFTATTAVLVFTGGNPNASIPPFSCTAGFFTSGVSFDLGLQLGATSTGTGPGAVASQTVTGSRISFGVGSTASALTFGASGTLGV